MFIPDSRVTFMYLVALNLLVNNQLNSSLRQKLGTVSNHINSRVGVELLLLAAVADGAAVGDAVVLQVLVGAELVAVVAALQVDPV